MAPAIGWLAALARDGHVQAVREQVQGRVHQRDRDVDRGKESDAIVVEPCGEQDEAVLEPRRLDRQCQIHIGLFRPGILDEFEGPHGPDPAGLSDPLVALGHLVQALADPGLQPLRPGAGLLGFVDGLGARGADDRVADAVPPQAPRAWGGSTRTAATRPATAGWLISRSSSSTRSFATSAGARP